MTYFDKIINKIFTGQGSPKKPEIREVINRSSKDIALFNRWKNSSTCKELIQQIAQAYYYKKTDINDDINIHLFNSPYANGFAITYQPIINKKEFQYLFDFFKDQVLGMDYKLVDSDRCTTDKGDFVEIKEKHFLKPVLKREQKNNPYVLSRQLYGNILLEHVVINNTPSYIKVLANIYSDSMYEEAMDYDDFITNLFETN